MTTVRAGRPDEAEALSALILRSKAHWGYDRAHLDACREVLRLRADEVTARRTLVAERGGTVVGVATVDGEPPHGTIGLLFVEPDAIGSGVGRLLYRHVLDEAARVGFDEVTIESDPHAVGFYAAMGAWQDGRRLVAYPEPAWSTAWNAGAPMVRVGNVAEFNGQFGARSRGPDHYSCLVAFCGRRPAAIVLPQPVDEWWVRHVETVLGWENLRVSTALSEAPAGRPVPWGLTAAFASTQVLATVRRYESKRNAHELFRALARPGIVVPAQRPMGSRRALARELAAGGRVVLKREYGVGGSGTLVVSAGTGGLRRWAGSLVEEYVDAVDNPTFDAVVDADGRVHPVGVGVMEVVGTGYRGVTVGPGLLPDHLVAAATAFGLDVGRVLAAEGYRGWYDVDFVTARDGRLAPVEINIRLTGPAAAFNLRDVLDRRPLVRTVDWMPLGARLPPAALRDHVARFPGNVVVTIPTAAFDPAPYLGVAISGRTRRELDDTEAAVRAANADLGAMFADLTPASRRGPRWRRRSSGTR
ncbi:hypothetical protein GCM10022243_67610 [Saccharothrix violaceirubra]|uniref:GNAT superfamily N-acetyltransferase n=1 Tax=Saccharothrix violaceirubra TaxID=413306 RepID=A0A7W7T2C9_9PSEU|nr:GNAT family N-acetyltransferase [Saccharothrix violaceirubra]MBB4965289.1 GNAT superfamily N-acetyltransferase [Saccharothrix violaceirubra]